LLLLLLLLLLFLFSELPTAYFLGAFFGSLW